MKVSAKEQHGLRAMAELAGRYGQGPVPLSEIADALGVSVDYLEQVVPSMRDAGLLQSTRGAHGGYELALPPDQIYHDLWVDTAGQSLSIGSSGSAVHSDSEPS